ncbi:hypothetical protein L1887_62656 [Cichorium endivia]|nr:hypothetical protein L1887_62656 [Cichorium endivia]
MRGVWNSSQKLSQVRRRERGCHSRQLDMIKRGPVSATTGDWTQDLRSNTGYGWAATVSPRVSLNTEHKNGDGASRSVAVSAFHFRANMAAPGLSLRPPGPPGSRFLTQCSAACRPPLASTRVKRLTRLAWQAQCSPWDRQNFADDPRSAFRRSDSPFRPSTVSRSCKISGDRRAVIAQHFAKVETKAPAQTQTDDMKFADL